MSKDLNNEFKQYMDEVTPDLWNRIEPALKPKTKVTKFNKKAIYKYSGLVAACLCLAVIIPVLLNLSRSADKGAAEAPDKMTAPGDDSAEESDYDTDYAGLRADKAQTEAYTAPCEPENVETDDADSYADNSVIAEKAQDTEQQNIMMTEQQNIKITDIIQDDSTGRIYYMATGNEDIIYLYTDEVVFTVGKEYTVFTENTGETRDSYPVYHVVSSEEKTK